MAEIKTKPTQVNVDHFIAAVEKRQGLKICSPEETAYRLGLIGADDVRRLARDFADTAYGRYLIDMLDQRLL